MSSGYRLIFWGLLLILLDIRIEVFDILPDFIGYILIVNGLNRLSIGQVLFNKAKPFAVSLILLSIPNLIGLVDLAIGENTVAFWPILYQLLITSIHLFMMYFIFEATHLFASEKEKNDWAASSKSIWNLYVIVQLIILTLHAFLLNFENYFIQAILLVSIIIALVIEIVVIVFMRRSRIECENLDIPNLH